MITATTNYQSALASYLYGPLIYLIQIDGYSRAFTNYDTGTVGQYKWLVSMDDLTVNVNDLDGGADQVTWGFTVQDRGAAITADFPGFTFEGKKVTLKQGFVGMAQADFITLFTGYIDTVASANSNLEYYFTCSDVSSKLQQVIYTTGDSGAATDSSNPKTLKAHPLDIVTDILLNKIGLDPSLVDTAKLNTYRDNVFSGVLFNFNVKQPPQADEFIKKQLLEPLGGYLWVNSQGLVTVNFFYPLQGPVAAQTITNRDWLQIPEAEQTDMVNTIQWQFDKDDGTGGTDQYLAQDTETYGPSTALYGQFGEKTIQADGLRSSLQGFSDAKLVSRIIFARYGLKNLKFDQAAPEGRWSLIRIEPGDIVGVTHPSVPDRKAGVMGITNKTFEVINKTISFAEGKVTLTMLDAGYLANFGTYKISPDGELPYAPVGPPAAPAISQVASGTLAARTEFFRLTYVTPSGETLAGTEASLAITANNVAQVASPPQAKEATGYNVYGSTSSGTETKQNASPIAIGTAWTEPNTGLVAGAAMPASDTSGVATVADQAKYMFLCNDSDKYGNNDPGHVLG